MKQLHTILCTLSRSLMLGVVMLLPVSCIEDCMDKSATGEGMVPINLTISPKAVSTRTATTDIQSAQLASGQTFYAYFTSADVAPQSTTFTANGSGGTTPATQPYFKLSETSTGVRAYYPSSVTEASTSFTVEANQSGDDAYRASDLMFASANITKVFPASTGALTFAHKMAKIRVNVTVNAGVSVSSVKLKNIKRQAPFTASTGAVGTAVASGSTDVTMFTSAGETSNFNCVALVPPQSITANATLITVTTANHTLVYEVPSAVTFASGYQYVYNVSVFDTQLIVTTNITAWDESTATPVPGQGTLNRPKLPIEYIAPYNLYKNGSVIQMATNNHVNNSGYFYWGTNSTTPSENMKKLINGTAVANYHLPSKAEWCAIVPPFYTSPVDDSMEGENGQRIRFGNGETNYDRKEKLAWGVRNNNTNSTWSDANYAYDVNRDFYNDYYCPKDQMYAYALRFKESIGETGNGQYTCAYRYEYKESDSSVGGGASLTVQVIYVGANPNITISTISNDSWWNTPEYIVIIPACGQKGNSYTDYDANAANFTTATTPQYGFYWSATKYNNATDIYNMDLLHTYLRGNNSHESGYSLSVRLFKDARPKLPIQYVAPYNMYDATTIATNNSATNCMYFSWNTSKVNVNGVGSGPKSDIQAMINGTAVAGYHLPSSAEFCSIVPPNYGITYNNGQNLNVIDRAAWGVRNINGSYSYAVDREFCNDYNNPTSSKIGYALRFKELDGCNGEYTCAYRYQYKASDASVGGSASLTINVKYVGDNPNITINTISNESWWSSSEYTVVLPGRGYGPWNIGGQNRPRGWDSPSGANPGSIYGMYWSSTIRDETNIFSLGFGPDWADGNHFSPPADSFFIRLFKDR